MKLHTVFITHNRLELTKRAIESYLETVSVPWTACIIDNGSTDGTRDWFFERFNDEPIGFTGLGENMYPGYAANLGWAFGTAWKRGDLNLPPSHLHRADNDHIFLPGWCEALEREFKAEKVGLVGLRTSEEELHAKSNVGGNCVIRRELWDQGLRWDERTWPELRDQLGEGITEDSLFAPEVVKMGYTWTRVRRPCIQPISSEDPTTDPDWPYYVKTFRDRGIHKHLTETA